MDILYDTIYACLCYNRTRILSHNQQAEQSASSWQFVTKYHDPNELLLYLIANTAYRMSPYPLSSIGSTCSTI